MSLPADGPGLTLPQFFQISQLGQQTVALGGISVTASDGDILTVDLRSSGNFTFNLASTDQLQVTVR